MKKPWTGGAVASTYGAGWTESGHQSRRIGFHIDRRLRTQIARHFSFN